MGCKEWRRDTQSSKQQQWWQVSIRWKKELESSNEDLKREREWRKVEKKG